MARRLAERGVRFIQVCDGGWDHHYSLPTLLPKKCREVDRPVGALLRDLKERGLLADTIVLLCGEFGRTPFVEGPLSFDDFGRDHNNKVGSLLLAGGGFKGGLSYGRTDDWGWDVVENPVHIHDLQATILHCLGIDHTKLVYRHQGRDFRLTDVGGRVVHELLA
jgi:arylsulfatase A-like enzyme